jgi:hypothetical protein
MQLPEVHAVSHALLGTVRGRSFIGGQEITRIHRPWKQPRYPTWGWRAVETKGSAPTWRPSSSRPTAVCPL